MTAAPGQPAQPPEPADPIGVVVEQVRPETTYGLRAAVLRPGLPPIQARFAGDEDHRARHYAAYLDSRVVGVVALVPENHPDGTVGPRLRGMAVADGLRGRGVGVALLERLLTDVGRDGGGVVWCKARWAAVRFYERAGFVGEGEPFEEPGRGPHLLMRVTVPG